LAAVNELDAYGKVAHAISIALLELIDPRDLPPKNELKLPPPYFYTYSLSIFEWTAEILWRLKIFRSLDHDNRFGVFFILSCDLVDVPVVAAGNAEGGPSLERLILAYFDLRSEYSRLHLDRSVLFFREGDPILAIREKCRTGISGARGRPVVPRARWPLPPLTRYGHPAERFRDFYVRGQFHSQTITT
jgi:hypothetical protein